MPRLTILVLPEDEYRLIRNAESKGVSLPHYLRARVAEALEEHNSLTHLGRRIPPAGLRPSRPLQVTIPDRQLHTMEITAERLGYNLSELVRAVIAQNSDSFQLFAHGLGFRSGQSLQRAITNGNLAVVALSEEFLPASSALEDLALNGQWPTDEHEQRQVSLLLMALRGALATARRCKETAALAQEGQSPLVRRHGADSKECRRVVFRRADWMAEQTYVPVTPENYAGKFDGFVQAILQAMWSADNIGVDDLRVSCPEVLGDTKGEILQSLSLLADSGCGMHVEDSGDASVQPTAQYELWFSELQSLVGEAGNSNSIAQYEPDGRPMTYLQIEQPGDLGGTYADLAVSLSLLAEHGVPLLVARPQPGAHSLQELLPWIG